VASAYAALGLEPGDAVGILMSNSTEMLMAMLGAVCGGYVAVPLNVSVADADIANMLTDCDARLLVASGSHVARLESMRAKLPAETRERLVAVGDAPPGWLDFNELLLRASADFRFARPQPDSPCNIIYSSGTTDVPKGIVHSHACRIAWAYDLSVALRYFPGARTLITLGLFSNISWVMLLNSMLCGGTIVLQPGFSPADCLSAIGSHAITHVSMVPVMLDRLIADGDLEEHDLTSLKSLMCCGSPLNPALKLRAIEDLTPNLIELYGLTEGLITIQEPADAKRYPESVGRPAPGQDVRIIDAGGTPVDAGETGEVVGFGRLLMSGYLNRPEASEAATWIDPDGRRWLRTGDIGHVDLHGNLYIVDRKKDMIISGGQNVYPADIEAILSEHPVVDDVAVIGVRSERWGETPLAVVVANGDVDEQTLVDWTNARVGKQQRIRGVRRLDALPRNPNGKVLKRELRQQFADVSY
ncbi:MAG: AMP-binding protein, partial [Pseudomonadota bacterium]